VGGGVIRGLGEVFGCVGVTIGAGGTGGVVFTSISTFFPLIYRLIIIIIVLLILYI
jgi:hypothetical protein